MPPAIPDLITICRDVRFERVGKFGGERQYVGLSFYLSTGQRRLISVLHLFDADGDHTESLGWEEEPENQLDLAIGQLAGSRPNEVAKIKPFSVTLFGQQFGLFPREDGWGVEYLPYGLAFIAPWDGTYDT